MSYYRISLSIGNCQKTRVLFRFYAALVSSTDLERNLRGLFSLPVETSQAYATTMQRVRYMHHTVYEDQL